MYHLLRFAEFAYQNTMKEITLFRYVVGPHVVDSRGITVR